MLSEMSVVKQDKIVAQYTVWGIYLKKLEEDERKNA